MTNTFLSHHRTRLAGFFLAALLFSAAAPAQDLTGVWTTDRNETYYIQQVGSSIYWAGLSPDSGRTYTNVFYGSLSGNVVNGDWADVPRGLARGQGALSFDLVGAGSEMQLRRRTASGGFSASVWRRTSSHPAPVNHVITPSLQTGVDGMTGVWKGSDGATYYVRQVGALVYWLGMSSDGGRSFANVFRGYVTSLLTNTTVWGTWADIPHASGNGRGTLGFSVSNTQSVSGSTGRVLTRTSETGGFGANTWWGDPDFAAPVYSPKLNPTNGTVPVVTILWVPKGLSAYNAANGKSLFVPSLAQLNASLFSGRPSVADWFSENSNRKLQLTNAAILGPYTSQKEWSHYWVDENPLYYPLDLDGDGWVDGHIEKWAEAIRAASRDFDFSRFDRNGNKVIEANELAVLIVIPWDSPGGYFRGTLGREVTSVLGTFSRYDRQPLVVNGVNVPVISEWYPGPNLVFGTPAHELCHQIFNAPDLYFTKNPGWQFRPGSYSIMDADRLGGHIDAFEKLKLGWISYGVISESGDYSLQDVETGNQALIVYDKRRGPGEYFLIENRFKGVSYDAGFNGTGGIAASGLVIWHIVEDPAIFNTILASDAEQGEWGRRGIRLIRGDGGVSPINDANALFTNWAQVSDDTVPANLRWLDGSRSGISIQAIPAADSANPTITVRIRMQ